MSAGPKPDDVVNLLNHTLERMPSGDWVGWIDPAEGDTDGEPLVAVRGNGPDEVRRSLMIAFLTVVGKEEERNGPDAAKALTERHGIRLLNKEIPPATWPPENGRYRNYDCLGPRGLEYLGRPEGFSMSEAVGKLLQEAENQGEQMSANTVPITDADFEQSVIKSDKPVLIDFWADWCGPCHMVAPVIEEIAAEHKEKLIVGKLDVDANPEVSRRYGILSIPSMLLFVDGVEKVRLVGARGKAQIVSELTPYL